MYVVSLVLGGEGDGDGDGDGEGGGLGLPAWLRVDHGSYDM